MAKILKLGLLLLILLLVASIPLALQFDTGAVEGFITCDIGPVAGASIEARNVFNGAMFHAMSDANGYYRLQNLKAGRYSLRVEAFGLDTTFIPRVIVEHDQITRMDIHLITSGTAVPGG